MLLINGLGGTLTYTIHTCFPKNIFETKSFSVSFLFFIMQLHFEQGEHGINEQVYLSLPCVLTSNGVSHIVKQILTESETNQLQKSAKLMHDVQVGLKF